MDYKGNSGMARLGKVLSERMSREAESPLVLDFGVIGADYSVTTNTFPRPIPVADYTVCRHLVERKLKLSDTHTVTSKGTATGSISETTNEGDTVSSSFSGLADVSGISTHEHIYKTRYLKPGDRVLVAWVQNEPCVIDVIISAEKITAGGEEL